MENFQVSLADAKKTIRVADHMLVMTFPLLKDPKLLLAVTENIHRALNDGVNCVLQYERLFKRIPVYQETYEAKMVVFKDKIVNRYNISRNYLLLMNDVKEILDAHKKSPVEFSRGDRFVICSENYRMKTIGVSDLKKYIAQTKMFLSEIERLVSKNVGIFK